MSTQNANTLDIKKFRAGLGCYPTGVTVVTTRDATGEARGFTANSFTSVSLDPPLVLVCLAKTAHSHAVFAEAPSFAIHVLSEAQKEVSSLFASKASDKFDRCQWTAGLGGVPLIQSSLAVFECTAHQFLDAGDHTILIGRVINLEHNAGRPLGYCRGAYVGYQDVEALDANSNIKAHLHALIETEKGVLMVQDAQGRYELPGAPRLGKPGNGEGLHGVLQAFGLQASLDFVFSVYEDAQGPCVIYRGRAPSAGTANTQLHCIALDDLAQTRFVDEATASVVTRYTRERREDRFGIYVGDVHSGEVSPLL
jgi:flavin reductase (DIM6/NTAB) family NADH-FMN oxidoreductase RutF